MSKTCKICGLPPRTRKAIDRALIEGASANAVAKRFKHVVSISGVNRHRNAGHVPVYFPELRAAAEGQVLLDRRGLDRLKDIIERQWDMFRAADAAGQIANANTSLRDLGANIERLSVLSGEMAAAKAMRLKDVTIDEKLITNFPEAATHRPDYILQHLHKEIKRIGVAPIVIQINFKDPPARESNGNLLREMAGIVAHYPEPPALPAPEVVPPTT